MHDAPPGLEVPTGFVITEDDYIGFLSESPVESLVPTQLLTKLRDSRFLFLGYGVREWSLRVFLRRVWPEGEPGATSWAVQAGADEVDDDFWRTLEVERFDLSPADYLADLEQFLQPVSGAPPYVGLAPFGEADADRFFGRDAERKRIIANLQASRFTLLYARSGVGKSSLLRAGVVARIAAAPGSRLVPFIFSSWSGDPNVELPKALGADGDGLEPALERMTGAIEGVAAGDPRPVRGVLRVPPRDARGRALRRRPRRLRAADGPARALPRVDPRGRVLAPRGRVQGPPAERLLELPPPRRPRRARRARGDRGAAAARGQRGASIEPALVDRVLHDVRRDEASNGHSPLRDGPPAVRPAAPVGRGGQARLLAAAAGDAGAARGLEGDLRAPLRRGGGRPGLRRAGRARQSVPLSRHHRRHQARGERRRPGGARRRPAADPRARARAPSRGACPDAGRRRRPDPLRARARPPRRAGPRVAPRAREGARDASAQAHGGRARPARRAVGRVDRLGAARARRGRAAGRSRAGAGARRAVRQPAVGRPRAQPRARPLRVAAQQHSRGRERAPARADGFAGPEPPRCRARLARRALAGRRRRGDRGARRSARMARPAGRCPGGPAVRRRTGGLRRWRRDRGDDSGRRRGRADRRRRRTGSDRRRHAAGRQRRRALRRRPRPRHDPRCGRADRPDAREPDACRR